MYKFIGDVKELKKIGYDKHYYDYYKTIEIAPNAWNHILIFNKDKKYDIGWGEPKLVDVKSKVLYIDKSDVLYGSYCFRECTEDDIEELIKSGLVEKVNA